METLVPVRLPPRSVIAAIIGLFFLLGILVYGQSLRNDFVRWDDGLLIYENQAIRSITPSTLKTIFTTYDPELYIPLTLFSFQTDFLIAGPRAPWYHFHNLVLHTLNALLVSWLSLLLSRKPWIGLFCGLLFLLHPIQTEAVAWSSARKDVLSTFHFLISFISFLSYCESRKRWQYAVSLVTFLLGLLAKVTILPLPLILLLTLWRQKGHIGKREILLSLPYVALSVVFTVIAFFGKTSMLSSVSLMDIIAMGGKSTIFTLGKILWPAQLSVLYPMNRDIVPASPEFLIPLFAIGAILATAIVLLRRTKEPMFAGIFFMLMLAPSLPNFAKGGTYYITSDRYAYIPSISAFLMFMILIDELIVRKRWSLAMMSSALTALLIALGVKAHAQSLTWQDSETLFENVLSVAPDSHVAWNNIGNVYRERGEVERAIAAYNHSLAIRMNADIPGDDDREARMEFETNIANALTTEGRLDEAIAHYNEAISAESNAKILANLGAAYRARGDLIHAKEKYLQALALNLLSPQAMLGIGVVYQQLGDLVSAEKSFRDAIDTAPLFSSAHLNLGALLVNTGRIEEGIASYDSAIEINPFFPQAHYNKGVALQKLSRNREALDAYMEAVTLAPNFVAARINAGILLAERKKFEEATEQFNAVLQVDPENSRARAALQELRGIR
ncbi:tetratricopeptide repeat protein [Candidatus Peregrinibacteria bacterium]|nr:tetratricopeptide repeat protein [Candidatus Peregrinibacteria bacterium]